MKLSVELKGNWVTGLVDIQGTAEEALRNAVDRVGEAGTRAMRRDVPKGATRTLAGSISYRGKQERDGLYLGVARVAAPYAQYVVFGTKSRGKSSRLNAEAEAWRRSLNYHYNVVPGRLPPLDQLSDWLSFRGIDQRYLWPIALSIATHGVRSQDFVFPAVADMRADLPRVATKGLNAALKQARASRGRG